MKKFLFLAALAALSLCTLNSCVQVQQAEPTATTVSNESFAPLTGKYTASLGCSLFEADKAIRAAARTMRLHPLARTNETTRLTYEYKDVYDARISIRLEQDPNGLARITIKFSKLGDKDFSRKFLAVIDEQLHIQE